MAHVSLLGRYERLLRDADALSEERALHAAYDLGRELLGAGAGVLDLAGIHRRVVMRLLIDTSPNRHARVDRCLRLFTESLVPFEMAHRGYRDLNLELLARDIADRRRAESALRHENRQLEQKAQRIAHALHDEAGQLLASVYLAVAEMAGEVPRDSRKRLDELTVLLDQVDDQIRRLAHELRPMILDDLGLLPACEFLAEGTSQRAGIPVIVVGSTGGRLPADVEIALYRVIQEALSNAVKHARAARVVVGFDRRAAALVGEVRDDGVGFNPQTVFSRTVKGLGLIGMRERLAAVRGTLVIDSSPGRGTTLRIEVPLET